MRSLFSVPTWLCGFSPLGFPPTSKTQHLFLFPIHPWHCWMCNKWKKKNALCKMKMALPPHKRNSSLYILSSKLKYFFCLDFSYFTNRPHRPAARSLAITRCPQPQHLHSSRNGRTPQGGRHHRYWCRIRFLKSGTCSVHFTQRSPIRQANTGGCCVSRPTCFKLVGGCPHYILVGS